MKVTTYNPFDYFETEEEEIAYLNAAFADDDPRVSVVAVGYLAKKRGMASVAEKANLSRENLYRALSGEHNPAFGTMMKVVHALGIELRAAA